MTKTKAMHVQNVTDDWKTMAAASNYKHLLNQLLSGDVTSNELYYHKSDIRNFVMIIEIPKIEAKGLTQTMIG